jgi:phosphonate transport system substrate-binding protein
MKLRSSKAVGPLVAAAMAALVLTSAACTGSTPTGPAGVPTTLRVGIIPNVSPETQRAQYEPFQQYLAGRLNVKVELFVATDYAGVVEALVAKRVDLAYLGGLTYAQAAEQANVTPLVTEIDLETGTPKYLSAVVVRADAPHRTIRDLLDSRARFAFGDPSSTSGSLYPRIMLVEAGARYDAADLTKMDPLSSVVFTGGHDAAAQAVVNGSADAAGLELRILRRLERKGSVKMGALRVIETREVMGYPWVIRDGLGAQPRQAIVDAFTGITDAKLLELMRARGYVAVTAEDYRDVREAATRLGLLTQRD